MKPATTTMTQIDELPGEEIEFSIGDPRWVMRSQADLYSNRELAVAREYSTNAFDANKQIALDEGREPEPIKVTLPTMLNPFFIVRDFGYGMTLDILRDVYTKFGTSTKRDSNHYNGMLGYGSKSAVAYAEQFTVTSIADGIKTIAVVTRKPDWSIVMKIVSQTKSDERSGTEIKVPVHNWQEFTQKANDFYQYWRVGTVQVNGSFPEQKVGEQITENFYYSTGYNSYIVMGNVPYKIENPAALFYNTGMNAINFVAYVDTGEVEFTPSREALKYTDKTKAVLQQVINDFAAEIKDKAKKEIDAATTHAEAYQAWKKWTGILGKGLFSGLEFKGDKFSSDFAVNAYQYRYGVRNGSYRVKDWHVESADTTLFILDSGVGNPSSSQKAKAQEYKSMLRSQKNYPHQLRYVLFCREAEIDCPWIDTTGDNFVTWEALKAALPKAPPAARGGGKSKQVKGSFEMHVRDKSLGESEIPDGYDGTKYFWITPSERNRRGINIRSVIHYLPQASQDVTVVVVGMNRLNKFKRDYPDVKEFLPWVESQIIKDGPSLLSDDAKDVLSMDYTDKRWLEVIDVRQVDDPEIVRYAKVAKSQADKSEYDRNLSLANYIGKYAYVKEYQPKKEKKVFKKYPLLEYLNVYNRHKDMYLYMNAAYAARKDDK